MKELFNQITSGVVVTIVQRGFLYSDHVDTRERDLVLEDFVTLFRYLISNKYLEMRCKIKGKENVNNIINEFKKLGVSVDVLRNEESWLGVEVYEVDALLSINLPQEKKQSLIKEFYVVADAVLIYPVGYISWDEYFKRQRTDTHM